MVFFLPGPPMCVFLLPGRCTVQRRMQGASPGDGDPARGFLSSASRVWVATRGAVRPGCPSGAALCGSVARLVC